MTDNAFKQQTTVMIFSQSQKKKLTKRWPFDLYVIYFLFVENKKG